MTAPSDRADPPMAEPGKRPSGGDVGGIRATPLPAPTRATGIGAVDAGAQRNDKDDDEDKDEWRHEPVAPVDERNPLRSLGKAVGDTLIGSDPDTTAPPKR